MRVFKPALTAAFVAIFAASFVLAATLHRSLASIALTGVGPG
jgi:hypothetical protein